MKFSVVWELVSLQTQTYFRLSLVIFSGTSDSWKYICVRRLGVGTYKSNAYEKDHLYCLCDWLQIFLENISAKSSACFWLLTGLMLQLAQCQAMKPSLQQLRKGLSKNVTSKPLDNRQVCSLYNGRLILNVNEYMKDYICLCIYSELNKLLVTFTRLIIYWHICIP